MSYFTSLKISPGVFFRTGAAGEGWIAKSTDYIKCTKRSKPNFTRCYLNMIYVIAGEDIVTSRKKLTELLEGKSNVIRLDGKKASLAELDEAVSGASLFSESKVVVVENFSKLSAQGRSASGGKPDDRFWEILNQVQDDKNTDVILWDEADLSKKKYAKDVKVFNFQFPKFYYAFLDGFAPGSKKSLELLSEVLKTFEPEQVLHGLIRRVRQLLVMKSARFSEFSEFKRMQPWQISKLKKQASLWTEDQLKKTFLELVGLDEKLKSGGLTMGLSAHLDILILSDLN